MPLTPAIFSLPCTHQILYTLYIVMARNKCIPTHTDTYKRTHTCVLTNEDISSCICSILKWLDRHSSTLSLFYYTSYAPHQQATRYHFVV